MIKTDELFAEAVSLPLDIRTQLVDKLLQSLHPIKKEIDKLWAEEAEKRVEEIRSGKVVTIPGEEVFKKIRKRLGS
ncbi:MAG TPA: addiction module protein [Syntrophales bacterium]|nr:addiction module protein [Syntrophales bacterium]